MKPNTLLLLLVMLPAFACAGVSDPVADYKKLKNLQATDVLYSWARDIDADGRSSIFLCLKKSYDEDVDSGDTPSWHAYIPDPKGSGVIASCVQLSDGSIEPFPRIDISHVYVGYIKELKQRGIVTCHMDPMYPDHSEDQSHPHPDHPATVYIWAYVLKGDRLSKTELSKYDPDAKHDPIYEEYLTDTKRTKVQLQEVKP